MATKKKQPPSALDKGLPRAEATERLVLGSVMLNEKTWEAVSGALNEDDFFLESHRKIFSAMRWLSGAGQAIDRVTVTDELIRRGQLESVGGVSYVASLDDGLPEVVSINSYLKTLRDKSLARKLIFHSQGTINQLLLEDAPPESVAGRSAESIENLRFSYSPQEKFILTPEDVIDQVGYENFFEPWKVAPGLPTGFPKLDDLIYGLVEKTITVIAAESSTGKTAFALDIIRHACSAEKKPVLMFTGEMSAKVILYRLAAKQSGVSFTKFRRGWLNKEEADRFKQGMSEVYSWDLYLDSTRPLSIADMDARTVRWWREKGIALVVQDYIQLMDLQSSGDGITFRDERHALNYISKRFMSLVNRTGLPLIYLSQFNRGKRMRDKKDLRPKMSDLFGASLEHDANVILAIYREEFDKPGIESLKNTAELLLLKNRDGARETIYLDFIPRTMSFKEADRNGPPGTERPADQAPSADVPPAAGVDETHQGVFDLH